jgi:hypothetical protein
MLEAPDVDLVPDVKQSQPLSLAGTLQTSVNRPPMSAIGAEPDTTVPPKTQSGHYRKCLVAALTWPWLSLVKLKIGIPDGAG